MAATQAAEENIRSGHRLSCPGDEVLITGVSGYFPSCDSVIQLQENLFNKVDLISTDDLRWKADPEIPHAMGKINNVNKFDAAFFGIQNKQANAMDPACRMLMEKTYEALFDAGVNPKEIRNTNCGVFIGTCFMESEKTLIYERENINKYGLTGCSRAMMPNRISYWLGVTGPSYHIDSACSSSFYALEHAYKAIRDGQCDSAVVGAANLCLSPHLSLLLAKLGVLSPEGHCKSFDNSANGYVRSEAVVVIFLQKAKHSRRAYAQVVHAKTNCDGFKERGITHPSGKIQKLLLREFYDECSVSPQNVDFVEAHGTGTKAGDPEELSAINQIFCTDRSGPLKIGSIKSNLGHAEPASGLVAIAKMCIAYSTGFIPPNLHYVSPCKRIPALAENKFDVVTEKTPWDRGLSAINNFGFGGANAHVLLKNVAKTKVNNSLPSDSLPRLVCVSGRTESAVAKILQDLSSHTVDVEQVRLLHAVHAEDIKGHVFRGYSILGSDPEKAVPLARDLQYFSGVRRPVYFVYSGMGSQWAGMGAQLMTIPVFAAAIQRCHKALEPKGVNLTAIIITEPDPNIFNNILNSFVGIAAIQIGLTDVLKSIGIEPDYIIGHSVGELGCAYADGCLTAEQMILAAYSRGLVSIETPFIRGAMFAVNIGYNKIKTMCPPEIEVACHNGPNYTTISGPAEETKCFAAKLNSQGIFTKEVSCSNIPYHSKYIKEAGPTLLKYLKEIIPEPKPRSEKWLSTSVPQSLWKDPKHALSSAEYHTNNFLGPVLFEKTSRQIPNNAITIEIAPHGLLQAILRRSLNKDVLNIPLTERNNKDNFQVFLNALGKLYEAGLNPHLANLYPHVEFPVSHGTPMLSHLVEWDHSEDWYVMSNDSRESKNFIERTIKMFVNDENNKYITTHIIGGENLYPEAGFLVLVWETYAMMLGQKYTDISVVFENIRFHRSTIVPRDGNLEFVVMIQKSNKNFEVIESGSTIVTGLIYAKNNISKEYYNLPHVTDLIDPSTKNMLTIDFYKELRLRRYQYGAPFRVIQECNVQCTYGYVSWSDNWVTFMDSIFQLKIVGTDTRGILLPTWIENLSIDTAKHYSAISGNKSDKKKTIEIVEDRDVNVTRAGGIELRGCHLTPVAKSVYLDNPVLERYEFYLHFGKNTMNIEDILRIEIQLIVENLLTYQLKILELVDSEYETNKFSPLLEIIGNIVDDMNMVQAELALISIEPTEMTPNMKCLNEKLSGKSDVVLFIGANLMKRPDVLKKAMATLRDKCFIISREKNHPDPKHYTDEYDIICIHDTGVEYLVLFRKNANNNNRSTNFVKIESSDESFKWIDQVKQHLEEGQKLVLYSQDEPINGLLGLVNCLRKEPGGENVCGLLIADPSAPAFNPDLEFYKQQLDKDLGVNVYQNGEWGSYRHQPIGKQETVSVDHAYLKSTAIGDRFSLSWQEGPLTEDFIFRSPENVLIHVYCATVNFRDVLIASGQITANTVVKDRLQQECVQGMEVAGRTPDGARVMGIVRGGLSNMVEGDKSLLWFIPDKWRFEEAATVPVAYSTVYHALVMVGHLQRGESILIHAGSGGVGQAAINVALHYGCEIFTTVGTAEERDFIKKIFPHFKDSHIGNARDTTFVDMVKKQTKGKGVYVVLTSLECDKLQTSARCLAHHGRLLVLNRFTNNTSTSLETLGFTADISYHSITMDYTQQPSQLKMWLQDVVQKGIGSGAVRPLTSRTFEKSEVEAAFQYVVPEQYTGKVIIKIRDEEPTKSPIKPSPMLISAVPRYLCHEEQVYILVGGLGGFGLELAEWLILRGARKIVLVSRRGVSNGYQVSRLRVWTSYGVKIQISTDDVTTETGCKAMLRTAITMGPVAAIFNLALVLKDSLFDNQTPETFRTVCRPKAYATLNLDKFSRKLCPDLKNFVVFSSMTSGRGNAGQTNYNFANSMMERICEERRKAGLPGLAVQWGAVGDVGVLTDSQEEDVQLVICGTVQQKIASCLLAFDRFLKQDAVVVTSMVVAEKITMEKAKTTTVVDAIANIMGVKDLKTVSQQMSLAELGLDSMMAIEIKQSLERDFQIFLALCDIRTLTFAKLMELSAH